MPKNGCCVEMMVKDQITCKRLIYMFSGVRSKINICYFPMNKLFLKENKSTLVGTSASKKQRASRG